MMTKTLDKLVIGEKGVVQKIAGDGLIRHRLLAMGLTPGAVVYLRKRAPFGDPIEITVRDYELTLRKIEAADIVLESVE